MTGSKSHELEMQTRLFAGGEERALDDEPDETISERLWGLTEMFPESVRNFTCNVVSYTQKGIQGLYKVTCSASWIVFTSSMILFAPVVFEAERSNMVEMNRLHQKHVLLGTGSGASAASGLPPIQ